MSLLSRFRSAPRRVIDQPIPEDELLEATVVDQALRDKLLRYHLAECALAAPEPDPRAVCTCGLLPIVEGCLRPGTRLVFRDGSSIDVPR